MSKNAITIEIPGVGRREIRTIVSDYTGTLSCAVKLVSGEAERVQKLLESVDIHIVTSDSFGTAKEQLKNVLEPYILRQERHDLEKEDYVKKFDIEHVAALGDGNNDRLLLKRVKHTGGFAIAVDNGEGCALDALCNADIFIVGAANALDLLLQTNLCKATLRF